MGRKIACVVIAVALAALALVGCANTGLESDAQKQIAAAKAALADANANGVKVPANEQKKISDAESKVSSSSLEALVLAVEAKEDINNDINDAFNVAQGTYNAAAAAAQSAINSAPAGTDLTQAEQSLQNAKTKQAQAKTISDWYSPTDGPIYWAQLAASQATAAAVAAATKQGTQQGVSAEQKVIEQASALIINAMNNWLQSKGFNPADFTVGIVKVSPDASTVTGVATALNPAPSQPVKTTFVFQFENGIWVLKSAT